MKDWKKDDFNEYIPWHIKEKIEKEYLRIYHDRYKDVNEPLYEIMKNFWVNGYYSALENMYNEEKQSKKL